MVKLQEIQPLLFVVVQPFATGVVRTQENRFFVEGWALHLQVSMQEIVFFPVEQFANRGVRIQENVLFPGEWFQLGGFWGIIHEQKPNVFGGPSKVY